MVKSLSTLIFIVIFSLPIKGQPYYAASWKLDGIINGFSLAALGTTYELSKNVQGLTVEEINALDRNGLNALDRRATYNNSQCAKTMSDILLYSSFLLPALPLVDKRMKEDQGKIYLLYAETLLLTHGITQLSKNIALRTRPYVYNEDVSIEEKLSVNSRYSFFSGHVSTVSSLTFLTASIISQYHPKGKLMPLVWSTAALLPVATGYFRVKSGKHFPTDVMVGYATGALIGIMVPNLHLIKKLNKKGATIQVGTNYMVINLIL